jgi:hypothetical protein
MGKKPLVYRNLERKTPMISRVWIVIGINRAG